MNVEERKELRHETARKIEILLSELEEKTGCAVRQIEVRSSNITKDDEIDMTYLRNINIEMDSKFYTKWPHQNP